MPGPLTIQLQTTREEYDLEKAAEPTSGLAVGAAAPLPAAPGGGLQEARFVEAVAAPIVGAVEALAGRIVDDWLANRRRGLSMDLTVWPFQVSDLAGVPRGFLAVKAPPDGRTSVHVLDKVGPKQLAAVVERHLRQASP